QAVQPPVIARVGFWQQPGTTTAIYRTLSPVTVALLDSWGNVMTSSTDLVSISALYLYQPLSGTTTKPLSGGFATFTHLRIPVVSYGLQLSGSVQEGYTYAFGNSAPFDSRSPQLVFTQQPTNTTAFYRAISPVQVTFEDADGVPITSPIQVGIGSNGWP